MAIIEKYYLYRPDGTEEIKVEKNEPNLNIVKRSQALILAKNTKR